LEALRDLVVVGTGRDEVDRDAGLLLEPVDELLLDLLRRAGVVAPPRDLGRGLDGGPVDGLGRRLVARGGGAVGPGHARAGARGEREGGGRRERGGGGAGATPARGPAGWGADRTGGGEG